MNDPTISEKFLISFAPEQMKSVDRLRIFTCGDVKNNKLLRRGIETVSDHLKKFEVLAEIANEIAPKLGIDQDELLKNGYSSAKYSRQLAALIECCVNELYASLDGMRDVIYSVYGDIQGVQKKSTGKLFERAYNDDYGAGFPAKLREVLSDAHGQWFTTLRKYRTEFIHGSLGSCHLDTSTNIISYMHGGLGSKSKALVIENIPKYINDTVKQCIILQEKIFELLFDELPLETTKIVCGIYKGLVYQRKINPERPLTKDSGVCISMKYDIQCPLKDDCGAYKRAKEHNKAN